MKKRYIDANKLEQEIIQSKENNPHSNNIQKQMHTHEHRHFLTMLAKAPTEDVKEVIYGTWRLETDAEERNPMFKMVECSNCMHLANTNYKFCPNCGATMTSLIVEDSEVKVESRP